MTTDCALPLGGVEVLDRSTGIAGLYCAKLLSDAGATVRCTEAAASVLHLRGRGSLGQFLNRGKHVCTADLGELLRSADVLVQSSGDQVGDLRRLHPSMVIVTCTAFGMTGPWATRPATEFTLQAACGSMARRGPDGKAPQKVGGDLGAYMCGVHAAIGAVAALLARRGHGRGDHVDVSQLESMAATMTLQDALVEDFFSDARHGQPGLRINEIPAVEASSNGFVVFTPNTAQQFEDFLVMIGHPELIDGTNWGMQSNRVARQDELRAAIRGFTSKHSSEELLQLASDFRVPAGPVGNGASLPNFEHLVERGVYITDPTSQTRMPRRPYRITGADAAEHAGRVRRPTTNARGALPLAGYRVVDCTAWWAGTSAVNVLALLGADVIKVESTARPDPIRTFFTKPPPAARWYETGSLFQVLNTTRRDITLDLRSEECRSIFRRLLGTAHLLMENYTPRVMESFGFGWASVHSVNPDLTMVRMPAFGLDGPWRDRPGFAQTMECMAGIAWMTGDSSGSPLLARGACDPLSGLHAAFATLSALVATDCGGRLIESTMIEAALNVTAEQVLEYETSGVLLERDGNRSLRASPQGVYPCEGIDEWVAVSVEDDDSWMRLCAHIGTEPWRGARAANVQERHTRADDVDEWFAAWSTERKSEELEDILTAAGIPASRVIRPESVHRNPQLRDRRFFEEVVHPFAGRFLAPTLPFHLSGIDAWIRSPAPTLGQHNDELLEELGIGAVERDHLYAGELIGTQPQNM